MNTVSIAELSEAEINAISGGDSWGGTPEGQASAGGTGFGEFCLISGIVALVLAAVLY
jgi:hypothetical protein